LQTKILKVYDISIQFGGIVALDGVSFDMDPGTILGLVGPNGAGKRQICSRIY
jgi:branched-chain amino acid transport system ATP-binding protein